MSQLNDLVVADRKAGKSDRKTVRDVLDYLDELGPDMIDGDSALGELALAYVLLSSDSPPSIKCEGCEFEADTFDELTQHEYKWEHGDGRLVERYLDVSTSDTVLLEAPTMDSVKVLVRAGDLD